LTFFFFCFCFCFGSCWQADKQAVSEEYTVVLTYNGMPKDEDKIGKLRTLFIDFTNSNVRNSINSYIVSKKKKFFFQH